MWNKEIEVGLSGAMLCSQIFGHEMIKNGEGLGGRGREPWIWGKIGRICGLLMLVRPTVTHTI